MADLTDPDEAIEFCSKLIEDAWEIPECGEDFAASVVEKAESMRDWIDENSTVTEKIATALENMRGGVDRWLEKVR